MSHFFSVLLVLHKFLFRKNKYSNLLNFTHNVPITKLSDDSNSILASSSNCFPHSLLTGTLLNVIKCYCSIPLGLQKEKHCLRYQNIATCLQSLHLHEEIILQLNLILLKNLIIIILVIFLFTELLMYF